MKTPYSIALVSVAMAALTQQATAKVDTQIIVDHDRVSEEAADHVRSILRDEGLITAESLVGLATALRDDKVTIDVEGLKLASYYDQVGNRNTTGAIACYTNCHSACHGSRGWR